MPSLSAFSQEPRGQTRILVKVGEIALKGRNRGWFHSLLARNLRAALDGLPGVRLEETGSVMVLSVPEGVAPEAAGRRIDRVFGIAAWSISRRAPRDVDAIAAVALDMIDPNAESFAVRVKRRDKSFPSTSQELERDVGAAIGAALSLRVDLTEPDTTVRVEVDRRCAYVATRQERGPGGLPVGSSGRALCLMSGGIDSPVATWAAMKRGLAIDYIHFSGAPFIEPVAGEKSLALARILNAYNAPKRGRMWIVDFGRHQKILSLASEPSHRVVLYRRQMVRVAEMVAERIGAQALVTGDSLGQVSSQTLPNMAAVERAADLPLLRPLLACDKRDVMERAASLGILRLSETRAADACPLFADSPQSTRVPLDALERAERRADAEALADEAARAARPVDPGRFHGDLERDPRGLPQRRTR